MVGSVFVLIIIFLFVKICLIGSEKCENVLQTFLPICLMIQGAKTRFCSKQRSVIFLIFIITRSQIRQDAVKSSLYLRTYER